MFYKTLKLSTILSVLIALTIIPIVVLSQTYTLYDGTTWKRHKDKQCKGPKQTTADRKAGSGVCDFGDNVPNDAKTVCEKKSEEHEVKSINESKGCAEPATGLKRIPFYYHHYYCFDAKKIVKHGTVDCKWYADPIDDGPKCDIDPNTFSITNKDYYFCIDGIYKEYYGPSLNP